MKKQITVLLIIVAFSMGCSNQTNKQNIEQWGVYEITINGPLTGNPFMDVELAAIFTNKSETINVPGFYDGNGIYRFRFSPGSQGQWTYRTQSNETEPWVYPYKREGVNNDFTQPDYEFFQNFDRRVRQLLEMGIEADVILFHEYDVWGYFQMGNEMNERYVHYLEYEDY